MNNIQGNQNQNFRPNTIYNQINNNNPNINRPPQNSMPNVINSGSGGLINQNLINQQINQNPIVNQGGGALESWTATNLYKPAYPVQVKTKFTLNKVNNQLNLNNKQINQDLNVIDSNRLGDFRNYQNELNEKLSKSNDNIYKSKKHFINFVLNSNNVNLSKNEIINEIKDKFGNIVENNDNLKNKLAKFSTYYKKKGTNEDQEWSIFNNLGITGSTSTKDSDSIGGNIQGSSPGRIHKRNDSNNTKTFTNIYGNTFTVPKTGYYN